jgi:hypothetical protein
MMQENEKNAVADSDILEAAKCREVVHEILNFGVSQRQMLIIIKLLSLELDNNEAMKRITQIVEERLSHDNISSSTTIIT